MLRADDSIVVMWSSQVDRSIVQRMAPYRKAIVAAVASVVAVGLAMIWQLDPDTVPGLAAQIGAVLTAVAGPMLVYLIPNDTPTLRQNFVATELRSSVAELVCQPPAVTAADVAHGLALLRRIAASLNQLATNANLGEILRRQQTRGQPRRGGTTPDPPPPVAGPSGDGAA